MIVVHSAVNDGHHDAFTLRDVPGRRAIQQLGAVQVVICLTPGSGRMVIRIIGLHVVSEQVVWVSPLDLRQGDQFAAERSHIGRSRHGQHLDVR